MIAPGNHWILDSLRGAPPSREKPFGGNFRLGVYDGSALDTGERLLPGEKLSSIGSSEPMDD